jgi:anti-sigma B factor antagonist
MINGGCTPGPIRPQQSPGRPAPARGDLVLRILLVQADGQASLTLIGDIDITTADTVSQAARDSLTQHPAGLSLDLRSLNFCDVAGVRALLSARREADAVQAKFRLIAPQAHVLRIFDLTDACDLLSATEEPP